RRRWQRVLRGRGRCGPAVLLDLLGGRQGTAAPRLARPPLPAVDRHVRKRGVRRRGAGRDRRDRRDGSPSRTGRTGPGTPPLPQHEPLRVDVLGHGLPQGSLARLIPGAFAGISLRWVLRGASGRVSPGALAPLPVRSRRVSGTVIYRDLG